MPMMTRRSALQHVLCATAPCIGGFPAPWLLLPQLAREQLTGSERAAMAQVARAFMERFGAPALSIAIARNGRLVYEQPFGVADTETGEQLRASSLFRIASVSKPITSVTIFSLVEKGKLGLTDRVFGPGAILGTEYGRPPYRRSIPEITVDHLLTHTAGGWQNDSSDPMFRFPEMNHAQLIGWALDNLPPLNPPGESFAYSNFGYCVLGRVIEKISGQSYSDFVRHEILPACGVSDMRIAGNTLKQRAPGEVTYLGQSGENPYGMNVARMDSHGGWLATATDLARFAAGVTGFGSMPGLLKRESVSRMVSPGPAEKPAAEVKYARGWNVRNDGRGNWWHNGSLPGTASIMVRTATGFSWAALCNTRRQPADEINLALDNLVWEMARCVRAWTP